MTIFKISQFFKKGDKESVVEKQEKLAITLLEVYQKSYSFDLATVRKKIKKMRPMRTVSYKKTADCFSLLKIMKFQPSLVWISRLYNCLPPPEGWELNEDVKEDIEAYKQVYTNEKLNVRPCYYYIIKLIEAAK